MHSIDYILQINKSRL